MEIQYKCQICGIRSEPCIHLVGVTKQISCCRCDEKKGDNPACSYHKPTRREMSKERRKRIERIAERILRPLGLTQAALEEHIRKEAMRHTISVLDSEFASPAQPSDLIRAIEVIEGANCMCGSEYQCKRCEFLASLEV